MAPSLYMRVMGGAWTGLAEPVQAMHEAPAGVRARGEMRVAHGPHSLVRAIALATRLPRPTPSADTRLVVAPQGDGETWVRTFDRRRMVTRQRDSSEGEIIERFGLLEFRFALQASATGGLLYVQQGVAAVWGSLRVPIPASWAPRVDAREEPFGPRRTAVVVSVTLPAIGVLITYDGFMTIEEARA